MRDKHVESIVNQFRERSKVGIDKYGVTLERADLSTLEWIDDCQLTVVSCVSPPFRGVRP